MKELSEEELSLRIRRELKTVKVMIELYCAKHHEAGGEGLCEECQELWDYTKQRVSHCPFGLEKPTCLNCTVHCFKPQRRDDIRQVMRFSGPRMSWRHPVLSIYHFIDGRRPAPMKGKKSKASSET